MASNFNSFSPNAIGRPDDSDLLCVVAGDELAELDIVLRDVPCDDSGNPSDWELLDLTGLHSCSLIFKDTLSSDPIGSFPGYAVGDPTDGHIVAQFPLGFLDGVNELIECEVEVTFYSGRITTAWNILKFKVRQGFD